MMSLYEKLNKNENGFTLIEVIITLSILVLLISVSAYAIKRNNNNQDVKLTAFKLSGYIRNTRLLAIDKNINIDFHLNIEKTAYWNSIDKNPKLISKKINIAFTSAKFTNGNKKLSTIRFFPDGSSTGAKIKISNKHKEISIVIDWLTGRVSFNEDV